MSLVAALLANSNLPAHTPKKQPPENARHLFDCLPYLYNDRLSFAFACPYALEVLGYSKHSLIKTIIPPS